MSNNNTTLKPIYLTTNINGFTPTTQSYIAIKRSQDIKSTDKHKHMNFVVEKINKRITTYKNLQSVPNFDIGNNYGHSENMDRIENLPGKRIAQKYMRKTIMIINFEII